MVWWEMFLVYFNRDVKGYVDGDNEIEVRNTVACVINLTWDIDMKKGVGGDFCADYRKKGMQCDEDVDGGC